MASSRYEHESQNTSLTVAETPPDLAECPRRGRDVLVRDAFRMVQMTATILKFSIRNTPFASVEEAWFATMDFLRVGGDIASRQAAKARFGAFEPDDVVKCLDRLYRRNEISLRHASTLRIWGEKGIAPNPSVRSEQNDARLWQDAMNKLGPMMQIRGII